MPLVASTVPADAATGVDPLSKVTVTFNYDVNYPFVLDGRNFRLELQQFQIADTKSSSVVPLQGNGPSIDSTNLIASLYPSVMLGCSTAYAVTIDAVMQESTDNGPWQQPGFGPLEQQLTLTFTTGAPDGEC